MAAETMEPDDPVDVVSGIGPARRDDLEAEGYETVEDLQRADIDELAGVVPSNVARQVKNKVGDGPGRGAAKGRPTSIAEAKGRAQQIPGAKAKGLKMGDGSQEARVLRKVADKSTPGAHMTVRKG